MNWVINHLALLFWDGIFLSPTIQCFCCQLTMHNDSICFVFAGIPCSNLKLLTIQESLYSNLGWMGMREEMVKLVICDGSLPYRKTQLSFLTQQLISGYSSIFTWSKNQHKFSVSCTQKTNLVFSIVKSILHLYDMFGQFFSDAITSQTIKT